MDSKSILVSIIIPLFNESESILTLVHEINLVMEEVSHDYEIILVDDGSLDNSWAVIESLALLDSRIQGIRLRKNFGKGPALSAGFEQIRGDIVLTLDADLQDNPSDIPVFLPSHRLWFS